MTANGTTGWMACSARWRPYSIRRKKIHSGACSAKATGRYAVASMSPTSRSSPYTAATTGASAHSSSAKATDVPSSSENARGNAASPPSSSRTNASSIPTRFRAMTVIVVTVTMP